MSEEIHVHVLCRALKGKEDETRAVFEALIEPTRQEPGCLRYTLYVDREKPADFWFFETWANQEALDRHMGTPGTAALIEKLQKLLVEPATLTTLSRLA